MISDKGVFPDPDRISALSMFPVSSDQTGVRSFLGLCNQLAFFVPDFQHHTVSLRQLTGKGRSFIWLPEHQVEFDKLKKFLSGNLAVRHFGSRRPVVLLTDASRLFGLGFTLGHIEHDKDNKPIFKIVHCGSKGLTPTQQCCMYVCMYDSGRPCGDVHRTDSRLGQGERSLRTYFPNAARMHILGMGN